MTPINHPHYAQSENDTHIFFYGGPFSNWCSAPFWAPWLYGEEVRDVYLWNCVEQYMMAHKAILFGDRKVAQQIMATDDPAEQKALGKTVQGYNDKRWAGISRTVVTVGCLNRFEQSPIGVDLLRATGDKILVEGSKFDKRWGVGLHWDDPAIEYVQNWDGTNWLGECLMNVRATLVGVEPFA